MNHGCRFLSAKAFAICLLLIPMACSGAEHSTVPGPTGGLGSGHGVFVTANVHFFNKSDRCAKITVYWSYALIPGWHEDSDVPPHYVHADQEWHFTMDYNQIGVGAAQMKVRAQVYNAADNSCIGSQGSDLEAIVHNISANEDRVASLHSVLSGEYGVYGLNLTQP